MEKAQQTKRIGACVRFDRRRESVRMFSTFTHLMNERHTIVFLLLLLLSLYARILCSLCFFLCLFFSNSVLLVWLVLVYLWLPCRADALTGWIRCIYVRWARSRACWPHSLTHSQCLCSTTHSHTTLRLRFKIAWFLCLVYALSLYNRSYIRSFSFRLQHWNKRYIASITTIINPSNRFCFIIRITFDTIMI